MTPIVFTGKTNNAGMQSQPLFSKGTQDPKASVLFFPHLALGVARGGLGPGFSFIPPYSGRRRLVLT